MKTSQATLETGKPLPARYTEDGAGGEGSVPVSARRAVLLVIGGAVAMSSSGMFVKLSGTTPGTAAFFRCALALVVLVPLVVLEHRRVGGRSPKRLASDALAGVFLGIDYVFWSTSVFDVGASIATVLVNVQVVAFPLLVWALGGVRPTGRFVATAPVMLVGVALASGALGAAQAGSRPVQGVVFGTLAGVSYALYLLLLRRGSGGRHLIYPVAVSTFSAAVTALVFGGLWSGVDWTPGWAALGWLAALAVLGQALAMVLVARGLSWLAPNVGGTVLLLQPVMAIGLGLIVLHERPTLTQYAGCAIVIAGVWYTSRVSAGRSRAGPRTPRPAPRSNPDSGPTGSGPADGRPPPVSDATG